MNEGASGGRSIRIAQKFANDAVKRGSPVAFLVTTCIGEGPTYCAAQELKCLANWQHQPVGGVIYRADILGKVRARPDVRQERVGID